MILDGLLNVLFSILRWFLTPILNQPDVSIGDGFVNAVADGMRFASALSTLTAQDKLFIAISFIVVIEAAVLGFKAVMFVVHRLPFIH